MPELRFVVGDEVEELAARLREITAVEPFGLPAKRLERRHERSGRPTKPWSYNGGSLSYFSHSSTSRRGDP
jgi:hypothetical protein